MTLPTHMPTCSLSVAVRLPTPRSVEMTLPTRAGRGATVLAGMCARSGLEAEGRASMVVVASRVASVGVIGLMG